MVGIRSNNLDGALGKRGVWWPIDRIEQNRPVGVRKAGGPELGFTSGIVGVPSREAEVALGQGGWT